MIIDCTQTLFAKDRTSDYIITSLNDTVYGQVKLNTIIETTDLISFKSIADNNYSKYSPDQIKGFKYKEELFVCRNVKVHSKLKSVVELDSLPMECHFLRTYVRGDVNLYAYVDQINDKHYYIERDHDLEELIYRVEEVRANGRIFAQQEFIFREQFKKFFSDKVIMYPDIEKTDFYDSDIVSLVNKYNMLPGQKESLYKSKSASLKISVKAGITLGLTSSKLTFRRLDGFEYLDTDFKDPGRMNVGLNVEYIFPAFNQRFSLYQELLFTPYKYIGRYTEGRYTYTFRSTTLFDISYLKISNLPRFRVIKWRNFSGFFNVGPVISIALKKKNTAVIEHKYPDPYDNLTSKTTETAIKDYSVCESSFAAGAGFNFKNFTFEYRYDSPDYLFVHSKHISHLFLLQYSVKL